MTFDSFLKRAGELATLAMRWFRPITFALLSLLFVSGFWLNAEMQAWLEIVALAPDWLTSLLTIIVVGVAGEKLAREVSAAVKSAK